MLQKLVLCKRRLVLSRVIRTNPVCSVVPAVPALDSAQVVLKGNLLG